MTPAAFNKWLAAMKAAGLARSAAEAGRLLGLSPNGVTYLKRHGTDLRTALACRALLHRLEPWS
jgi:DNA-binding CsgD family transcriptional regulator